MHLLSEGMLRRRGRGGGTVEVVSRVRAIRACLSAV